jgi:hypothetical protein
MYTWFFSMYQMVVYIAAPFFAIYMLKVLEFDYLTFTIITIASAVSSLLSMKIWGKLVDKYGSKKIMSITAFLIPAVPLLWITTTNWKILTCVELYSGIVWAGFNLSCSTFMFESVKPEFKVKYYTYNKVLYGIGVFIGAMFGVLLINMPPIIFSSSILLIFFVSGIFRIIIAFIFIPRIQEEKVVTINFKNGNPFGHLITLRPRSGPQYEIIHEHLKHEYTHKEQKKTEKSEKTEDKKDYKPGQKSKVVLLAKENDTENQKKDKTQRQILINPVKNDKKDRNTQKGSLGNTQSVARDKSRIYNNPIKPPRK